MSDPNETIWTAVAARAQAYQALHLADLGKAPLLEKANFLMTLGLPRAEAALLLGSTDESLRVAIYNAKKKAATVTATKPAKATVDA